MGDDSLSGLLIIFILLAIHAFATMMYTALSNVQVGRLKESTDGENGDSAHRAAAALAGDPRTIAAYQIVTTLLRFGIATSAVLGVAEPILEASPELNSALIYAVTVVIAAFITLLLGDIVPDAVGSRYANATAVWSARFMKLLTRILSPVIVVLLWASVAISRLFKSGSMVKTVTEEEIMTLIDAGHTLGAIEAEEKDMIYSVLQLDQTRVSEVMVPRIDVVAVEINQTLEEAREIFVESGYSRVPVYEQNMDKVKGVLYAKDLLTHWNHGDVNNTTISELMREAYFVPESKGADELLKELKSQMVHLGVVIDEYGGTAGLVTIEDIIEEIIGDIQDEYDLHEEAEYEQLSETEYLIDASIDLDDFNQMLSVNLPTEDSDTLGGYIYTHFGRIPEVEDTIDNDDFTLSVKSIEGHRIRKVRVVLKTPANQESDNGDPANQVSAAASS